MYEASSFGRIKSLDRYVRGKSKGVEFMKKVKERILKPAIRTGGYYLVTLGDGKGFRKNGSVHKLVAEAFIPNPDNLPTVNHKDGNKLNNHVDNLEWMTGRDNCLHAIEIGLSKVRGSHCATAKLDEDRVGKMRQMFKDGAAIRDIALRFEIHYTHCWNVVTGRSWKHVAL
jgi:hypothetical protein